MGRQALGLAGAVSDPYRVWLGQWQVVCHRVTWAWKSEGEGPKWSDSNVNNGVYAEKITVHMRCPKRDICIDLMLSSVKPTILQGGKGLSQKSEKRGQCLILLLHDAQ